ncbi:LAETG motif-containing sortase-dependent surface protein [Streptomyces fildesensis]|uniref:LAETG motif-containing sortase-dependent surface protein n=1 Tax=Streptomyces fildesensis TaxID=375757 RepID=A0ABW8BZN6_9ACTN
MTAVAVATSVLAIAATAPAHAEDTKKSVELVAPKSLEVGGAWGTGAVTVHNTGDTEDTKNHLYIVIGAEVFTGIDQVQAEYADGAGDSWHPLTLLGLDLGSTSNKVLGATADVTGSALHLAPHSSHTYRVRLRLPQSAETEPVQDIGLEADLAPGTDKGNQPTDWAARAFQDIKVAGLTTTVTGLPANIPADGKPRTFQVTMKAANHIDWHLSKSSFFLWQGQKYGQMTGPSACDAEVDVLDPVGHVWHRVGLGAAGWNQLDVDVAHWATGPVDQRVLTARITLGAGFKSTPKDTELDFGYYPGSGPNNFWTTSRFTSAQAAGAPKCVNPGKAVPVTTPSPSASATSHEVPDAAKPGRELAETGADGSTSLLGGAAALLALGAGTAFVTRRRAQRH